ncbi:MAG: twin-arginine translocation signal domain-containing protein, partial [Mesorhizobium sp.]
MSRIFAPSATGLSRRSFMTATVSAAAAAPLLSSPT